MLRKKDTHMTKKKPQIKLERDQKNHQMERQIDLP